MIPFEIWAPAAAVISAVAGGLFTLIASRNASRRMAEIEHNKLDSEKADRRNEDTQRLIDNLRAEVDRLERRVRELSAMLEREQAESADLRMRLREVTETANNLRHQVLVLQKRIQEGL